MVRTVLRTHGSPALGWQGSKGSKSRKRNSFSPHLRQEKSMDDFLPQIKGLVSGYQWPISVRFGNQSLIPLFTAHLVLDDLWCKTLVETLLIMYCNIFDDVLQVVITDSVCKNYVCQLSCFQHIQFQHRI